MCVCVLYCLDGSEDTFTVDFGSSVNKAVMKLYPDVDDDASTMSLECLSFDVPLIPPTVRLVVVVSNMSDDAAVGESHSLNNASGHQFVIMGTGVPDRRRRTQSVTIVRGQQYVMLTAEKIKDTETPDTIMISHFSLEDGPCGYYSSRK